VQTAHPTLAVERTIGSVAYLRRPRAKSTRGLVRRSAAGLIGILAGLAALTVVISTGSRFLGDVEVLLDQMESQVVVRAESAGHGFHHSIRFDLTLEAQVNGVARMSTREAQR
jgi:uncharacterized phage protein gp47/JayE